MSELFKSKAGWLTAAIHLSAAFACLLYINQIDVKAVLPVLILLVLAVPWGFLLQILLAQLLMAAGETPLPKYGE